MNCSFIEYFCWKVIMKPKTHEDFRESVCIGCLKPGCTRKVTEKTEYRVKDKIFNGFSLNDLNLPYGLCSGCYRAIQKETPFNRKNDIDYQRKKVSRHDVVNGYCTCWICSEGRSKKRLSLKHKRGPQTPKKVQESVTICSICHQRIGKGIRHKKPCKGFMKKRVDNLLKHADGNSVLEDKIAATVIQKRVVKKDEEISLQSKQGKMLRLRVNPKEVEKTLISHEALDAVKALTSQSDHSMKKNTRVLRKAIGRKKLQSGYRDHLTKRSRDARTFLRYLAFKSLHWLAGIVT